MQAVSLAPLQLTGFNAESIHFDVNPKYLDSEDPLKSQEGQKQKFEFFPEVISFPTQDNREGRIRLRVGINEDSESGEWASLYKLSISITGRFRWIDESPSVSDEEFRRYYVTSALSILYGLIRGRVVSLCSSSPYPRLMLPTITFEEMVQNLLEHSEQNGLNEQSRLGSEGEDSS